MAPIENDRYAWLTSEFLENILRLHEDPTANVTDFEINDAVAKGENYGSQMLRVLVKYSVDGRSMEKSFVIKTLMETTESMKNMGPLIAHLAHLYGLEFSFYRDILPRFKKYQNLIDPNFKCAPKCYTVCEDPVYYVFEDLKDDGYRNMDRRIGLDFNATAMLLHKLAILHAINAMLYEESPELFARHKIKVIGPDNPEMVSSMTSIMRDCRELCQNWPGYEHFTSKFQAFLDNVFSKINEAYENSNDDTFKTITHGDLWVNNIMYKFDETNAPVDLIMVDYQLGYYGSPALDLAYLFYTSTVNEVEERDWDRLLKIYHLELVKSLNLLKYPKKIPSLLDLQIQMLKRSQFAVLMAFCIAALRHLASSDDSNVDIMLSDSEKVLKLRREIFDDPSVRKRTQYLMDYFDRKGFL